MAENTPCLRRWWARSATSPNQLGVEGMHWEDVWIVTAESVILFMSVSLLGTSFFFLIKETHSYACSLLVTSRCAIRGPGPSMCMSGNVVIVLTLAPSTPFDLMEAFQPITQAFEGAHLLRTQRPWLKWRQSQFANPFGRIANGKEVRVLDMHPGVKNRERCQIIIDRRMGEPL